MSTLPSEFERQPVPPKSRLGLRNFLGQYASEHTAGTELMIGPLFVAAGVSAIDLILGLIVGNLLAVLSWTFMTAPIATRTRLTLYLSSAVISPPSSIIRRKSLFRPRPRRNLSGVCF